MRLGLKPCQNAPARVAACFRNLRRLFEFMPESLCILGKAIKRETWRQRQFQILVFRRLQERFEQRRIEALAAGQMLAPRAQTSCN